MSKLREPLPEKYEKFIAVLLETNSPKQASMEAGFRSGTGYRLQNNPLIKKRVEEERKRLRRGYMATVSVVLEELSRVSFSDIKEFASWDESGNFTLVASEHLTKAQSPAIKKVRSRSVTVRRTDKNGSVTETTTVNTEVEMHDKLAALDKLAKHLGFYQESERPVDRTDVLMMDVTLRFVLALAMHGPDGEGMPYPKAKDYAAAHPDEVLEWGKMRGLLPASREIVVPETPREWRGPGGAPGA